MSCISTAKFGISLRQPLRSLTAACATDINGSPFGVLVLVLAVARVTVLTISLIAIAPAVKSEVCMAPSWAWLVLALLRGIIVERREWWM